MTCYASKRLRIIPLLACVLLLSGLHSASAALTGSGSDIVKASGVVGGLIVHLNCSDGKLTSTLRINDAFLVHGVDAETADIKAAREHISARGVYGPVSVDAFDGRHLPYADNVVNLIVADDLGDVAMDEVMRVLAPRGVAMIDGQKTFKPLPEDIDEWTHFRYSAEGNMVCRDKRVGPPRHTQWIAGPIFQRHHGIEPSITASVTSGGRLFYIVDEAPIGFTGLPGQWRLVARDAFNGVPLWKRDMGKWGSKAWSYWTESHAARFNHPLHLRKRLIASGDRVYITLGYNSPVTALDAASGKTVMTYDGTDYADEFLLREGVLYVTVNDGPQKPWPGSGVRPRPPDRRPPPSKKTVWAIDAATGKVHWKSGPFLGNASKIDRMASMRHLNLTAAADGVYLVDEQHVVALDRQTGAERWRTERLVYPQPLKRDPNPGDYYHLYAGENIHTVVHYDGRLFVLHSTTGASMKHGTPAILQALDPATGEELWRYDKATPISYIEWPDVFVVSDTLWLPDRKAMTMIGLDTATGREKVVHSIKKALNVGHHHRCYPNRASENFAVLGRRGAEYVNFKTGELTLHHWMRTGCRSGHVLGNGLTYRPPDHCQCYMAFQPRGFLALSAQESEVNTQPLNTRLIKGPAYGKVDATDAVQPTDWPTYRHDAMRSAMATSPIPESPRTSWQTDLGCVPSAPTVAGGRVYVAREDAHQIIALDAASGKQAWVFTAGGRIDSPPTVALGCVLFGSRDGRVYCLRASDGQLVWRFGAAPRDRRIVAFGQVESTWPVRGSVLVSGGTAWFVAGRTSMLDGGVHAYTLDTMTGKLLDSQAVYEIQTETRTTGQLPQGALSDILTTDGEHVFLRGRQLELSPSIQDVTPAPLTATQPLLEIDGGFANKRWFHRAFWNFKSSGVRAKGNLIAFDQHRAYVAAANLPGGPNQTFHVPAGGSTERVGGLDGDGPSWLANPNLHVGGTILFATRAKADKTVADVPDPRGSLYGKSRSRPAPAIWRHHHFPIYPWAMVIGERHLAVAGPAAQVSKKDPWAGFEGRAGGQLYILDAATGRPLSELKLDACPVWDGIAIAKGRGYIAQQDGSIECFAQ